jgi:hypothetical protein
MSELKVDKVSPRTGNYVALNTVGMKNIIINGDMSIAQRGTSATGLGNGDNGYHTCDRWRFEEAGSPTFEFTQSQSTDVPTGQGFATSLKMDCTTADVSLAAADGLTIAQRIEGQNLQYLKKGTANAESVTLSFWVKSNKTGTYTAEIYDDDNTRQISKTYTINSASTWEKKTITFAGDTTGALNNDNLTSLYLFFWLGAGTDFTSGTLNTSWNSVTAANRVSSSQVNIGDDTANEWLITGIQLEAGTTASDFEFLPVDVNLQRCLRYYQLIAQGNAQYFSNGHYRNSTDLRTVYVHPVIMRASPTLDQASGTDYYEFFRDNSSDNFDDFNVFFSNNRQSLLINNTDVSGTGGQAGMLATDDANSYLALDAEL